MNLTEARSLVKNPKLITEVQDRSDNLFNRVLIEFKNGYSLSIICCIDPNKNYTYGSSEGLYEIAPMFESDFAPELFDDKDKGDDVIGLCNIKKIVHYLNKISNY